MRTLVISGYGVRLRYRNGAFIVEAKEGKEAYTPSDIESILILTSGVTISARAVRTASDYGIDIVFLNPRGDPAAVITHPYATRTVETRRAQYAAYERPLGAGAGLSEEILIGIYGVSNVEGMRALDTFKDLINWVLEEVRKRA